MLARIAMVMAIALLALLLGAPEDALACHKGDPPIPHGAQVSCDVVGGTDFTDLVLVDANGYVIGPISWVHEDRVQVIAFTPDGRPFRLSINVTDLLLYQDSSDVKMFDQAGGGNVLYYEALGCLSSDVPYLDLKNAVPDVFYEVALITASAGHVVPFVATSLETVRSDFWSLDQSGGTACENLTTQITNKVVYPAEQLTDEFGTLVNDIYDLYPLPFRIEPR